MLWWQCLPSGHANQLPSIVVLGADCRPPFGVQGLMSLDQVDIEVGANIQVGGCFGSPSLPAVLSSQPGSRRLCGPLPPCTPAPAQILRRSGTERQKRLAERIQPVLRRPHVLLVTLLVRAHVSCCACLCFACSLPCLLRCAGCMLCVRRPTPLAAACAHVA